MITQSEKHPSAVLIRDPDGRFNNDIEIDVDAKDSAMMVCITTIDDDGEQYTWISEADWDALIAHVEAQRAEANR